MVKRVMQLELNEHTREILGKPNFWCGPIAHLMRDVGYVEVKKKAEDEQAVVIQWLLNLYFEHGDQWKEKAREQIKKWVNIGVKNE